METAQSEAEEAEAHKDEGVVPKLRDDGNHFEQNVATLEFLIKRGAW